MAYVEFTIEPFVEGRPGQHVIAAIDAARKHDVDVEIGPFGSSFDVAIESVGTLVAAVSDAAFAHGATHVTVHVAREMPSAPAAFPIPKGVTE
ncbi:MAG TPA: hypothetical protein VES40_02040 [Ilumatobacteraceae bacterium]|nr:hypothetical protein [Ilumatobacteraceae bacterium]